MAVKPALLPLALSLALSVSLAACGSQSDTAGQDVQAGREDAADTAPRPPAPYPDAALVLSPDGIARKGATALAFGTERKAVDDYVVGALKRRAQASENAECGPGPMAFSTYGPLQLLFLEDRFVGWYLRETDAVAGETAARIVTIDGIAPGARMDALAAERQVRPIADSTLAGEFEYLSATGGMVTGFYRGDVRSGTVSSLAAGMNCFFR